MPVIQSGAKTWQAANSALFAAVAGIVAAVVRPAAAGVRLPVRHLYILL